MGSAGRLVEKRCGMCNRILIPTPYWIYKLRDKNGRLTYYCSYTCYRKAGGDSGKFEYYVKGKRI